MTASQTWLNRYNTLAKSRQQWLAQVLANKPANPARASIREYYVKRAQAAMKNVSDLSSAVHAHNRAVADILNRQYPINTASSAASSPSSSSSFGAQGGSLG